jgi:hypothetical protein
VSLILIGELLDPARDRRECQNDFQEGGSLGIVFTTGGGAVVTVWARGRLCSREYFGNGDNNSGLNCCKVADRWWLVAGLRNVICALDPRRTRGPALPPLPAEARLTSLFGGSCGGVLPEAPRMGAPEPKEKSEGVSGPTLDLMLSCCDKGRMDSLRRIQDPLDERESRESSGIGAVGRNSGCLIDGRRPDLGGVI